MKRLPPHESSSIGQRLKLEIKRRGISSAELAKKADVKTSFLYDIMSGKSSNPSTVKLARVAESLNVSLNYLVGSTDDPQEAGRSLAGAQNADYVSVPRLVVDVTAGTGKLATITRQAERYYFRRTWIAEHLKAAPEDLRMLYIAGDSMAPTLCHNDIVLVDTTQKTPSPPGIFVLFDGMGLSGKRLEHAPQAGKIRVIADNPQYSSYERSIDDTFIIGRVVWFAREM